MIYHCCDPRRRELVLAHPTLNGIDFVEVLDREAPPATPRQRTLLLRFLKDAPLLAVDQIAITGGERITGVGIEWVTRADAPDLTVIDPIEAGLPGFLTALPEPARVLAIRTDSAGDYSVYTLRLAASPGALSPPPGIDRVLSEVDFSFKVECPTDFDCAPRHDCPPEAAELPALSYLAKDYRSFRRLMLARMAQIMPEWRERNPADLGITLVEALAYTADRLSYAQDAVAAEAYLATARRRSSVRRHARLVDYPMHDGGNARVWVQLAVDAPGTVIRPADERFLTRVIGLDPVIDPAAEEAALTRGPLTFEPLHEKPLFPSLNAIDFYDWGGQECCLPKGATRATLAGDLANLAVGDVLIFEERLGPRTGQRSRRQPRHPPRRHALAPSRAASTDGLTGDPITEIRWVEEDALPFAFCISARLDDAAGGGLATRVSHALGNVLARRPRPDDPRRDPRPGPPAPPLARALRHRQPLRPPRAPGGAAALPPAAARAPGQPGHPLRPRRPARLGHRGHGPAPRQPPPLGGARRRDPERHPRLRGAPRPAAILPRRRALRGRDRARRLRPPPLRRRPQRPPPRLGHRLHRRLPRRQRHPRQRRGRRDPPRGHAAGRHHGGPQPAARPRRRRAREHGGGAPGRPLRLPPPGTGGHARRLRRGRPPPPRRPALGRDLPLERPRPHRLRHRRPLRRPPGHPGVRGRAARLPRTLPHGRLRPRDRRPPLRPDRARALRLRAAPTTSAPRSAAPSSKP